MSVVTTLIAGIFTFWISSDIIYLLLLRIFPSQKFPQKSLELFILTRGLGPLVISWLLYYLFLVAPHKPAWFYGLAMFAILASFLIFSRKHLREVLQDYKQLVALSSKFKRQDSLAKILLLIIALLFLFIFFVAICLPIVEGDALGFVTEARLIYRDLGFDNYPTSVADSATGYYYDTFQPPCLQTLYVWFYILTGSSELDYLPRAVSPFFALYTCLTLGSCFLGAPRSFTKALWATFALCTVPLFVSQSYHNTQDPIRIHVFFISLLAFSRFIVAPNFSSLSIFGSVLCLAIYAHFTCLMLIPIFCILLVFMPGHDCKRKYLGCFLVITLCALFLGGGIHYSRPEVVRRLFTHFPMAQEALDQPLRAIGLAQLLPPSLLAASPKANVWLAARRGQTSEWSSIIFGKLQLFSGIEWFGFIGWLSLAGIFLWWKTSTHPSARERIFFYSTILVAIMVTSDFRVMSSSNPRYIATILPLLCYFIGSIAPTLLDNLRQFFRVPRSVVATVLILTMAVPTVAVTSVRGAKIGVTNSGDLYRKARSLTWIPEVMYHPVSSLNALWTDFLGIRATIRFAFSTPAIQLIHSHDHFAAVFYLNENSPQDTTALVFHVTKYFYYAKRKGISYLDPRLEPLATITEVTAGRILLRSLGVKYVILDSYYDDHPLYATTTLKQILSDSRYSKIVYSFGSTKVVELLDS
jgi:hypothetical protein